jgi:DNA repair protein RAD5
MLSSRVGSFSCALYELMGRCQDCIVDYIGNCEDKNKEANCPMCNKGPIAMKDLRRVQRRRKRVNPLNGLYPDGEPSDGNKEVTIGRVDLVSSTKLRALVRKLEVMRVEEPTFKALVFSQFTSFLGELPYPVSFGCTS